MISFIEKIRDKGKAVNPDFLVVAQNSPELYMYPEYKDVIDGFGKEDIWYDDNSLQDSEETEYVLGYLDQAVKDGKFVLAIDYPTSSSKVCDFYDKCSSKGFACTISNRDLDLSKPIECN